MRIKAQDMSQLSEAERLAWLRLARTENVGPITFYQLVDHFGSAQKALDALPDLARRGGRKKPLVAASARDAEAEYARLSKLGGRLITAADPAYPLALGATDDAPPVLSVIGNVDLLNRSCIAIVGARNASLNGQKFAEKMARDLGARDQIVVSGLARGIDTAAHKGALASGTIAVVAGGIDVVYPEENKGLYERICADGGLVVAESKLGQKPFAASFPRRNRIVSGLSKGVIVVEATLRSGSLITARMAGEQGRDVFAVPGSPLDPRASGPNHLIREGATLVRGGDDVLEILMDFSGGGLREGLPRPSFSFAQALHSPLEFNDNMPENLQENVLSALSFTPVTVDELVRNCHVNVSTLQGLLLEMELAGRVKRLPGGRFSLVQDMQNYEEQL